MLKTVNFSVDSKLAKNTFKSGLRICKVRKDLHLDLMSGILKIKSKKQFFISQPATQW